jgi:hypothetical protein
MVNAEHAPAFSPICIQSEIPCGTAQNPHENSNFDAAKGRFGIDFQTSELRREG